MKNTEKQIAGIKSQTIGVEVEMNKIGRRQKSPRSFSEQTAPRTQPAGTVTAHGAHGTHRKENGNSSAIAVFKGIIHSNANW